MAAFICTCLSIAPADFTGCVVHDRVSRLQFERDEALQDKQRLKSQINDLADTLTLIANMVGHRGDTKSGDELLKSVQRLVDDRDFKHRMWARLTGDDFGKRAMKCCSECGDRVSICLHAQKAQDDAFLLALKQQNKINALQLQISRLKEDDE